MISIKNISKFLLLWLIIAACTNVSDKTTMSNIGGFKIDTIKGNGLVYTTSHNSNLKLTLTDTVLFKSFKQSLETEVVIVVDPDKQFQTFLGIGSSLTDAAAETFYKLSEQKQAAFMEAYFNPEKGIGYTLARTTIHSCDFSSGSYTYIDEHDSSLMSFNIEHDKKYRIPFIKKAIESAGGKLTLYASPWSPPAFMKTNNTMVQGGKLKKEYYQVWANYFVKFINAYEKEGIPVWGITIQNEPMATQRWESCIYTAEEERDFLKYNLGPTLERANMKDKKIIVWDHNRDMMFQRASVIFNDPEASKYAWGTGFHWYEDWKDGKPMFDNVAAVHEAFPDKHLLFTEGTNESYDFLRIEDPKLAERYGRAMINDFNNGTVGWTDWNILLDETGGPNHVGNLCFAPVHGQTVDDELIFTYSFYYIGHFSKFIRPGARRISSASSGNSLLCTSFINKDASLVTVVMNTSDSEIKYRLQIGSKNTDQSIPAHAIQSITIKNN